MASTRPSLLSADDLAADPMEVFTIVGKLGEGSYGSVHKALHKRTSTVCAIKLIPAENDMDDTVKEINIMNGCDSRYVVQFYGSYIKEGYLWIVMEYCGAGSASDIIKICGRTLTEGQIAVICRNVLEGLKYLHERRKIHRDIKAGNILLNTQGEAKLADFGVAGQLTDNQAKRNTVIGTPFWMAPEVIQEVGYGVLADIWSLGITCIEMAEGRPPYHKIHPMRAIFMIPTKPPPKLEDESKWAPNFIDFVAQCLTKNPNSRPTAEQLLQHPFIKGAPTLAVMGETVSEVMDLIAKGALEDDESDNDASDDEAPPMDTVRLSESTMKQVRPGIEANRKAAFEELPTVGPQAAARKAQDLRDRQSDSESSEDEEGASGTMKVMKKPGRKNNAGAKVVEDFFDSYATGTMVPVQGGDTGTMVIGSGDTGTMLTGSPKSVDTPGSKQDYQPAFMNFLRRGKDSKASAQEEAYDSTLKPSRNASPTAQGPPSGSSQQPARAASLRSASLSSQDLVSKNPSLDSLQELLDLLETSMEKELEATRIKFEMKRGPILDAIEAKKAALAAATRPAS
ncbi:serine/threonine-protein kinase 3-like protein [Phlyctochytrium arcticum]|nr:serine/threonine-protein kinase 3-like protein [Phlyctochytrium arcticum]